MQLVVFYLLAKGLSSCASAARVIVASPDVKRAFDQVPHNTLLQTLSDRKVPHHLLALLGAFLKGRKQFVQVGQCCSEVVPVISGIIQGSIRGPF